MAHNLAQSDLHTSAGAAPHAAVDADTVIRSVLFVASFLAAWISFHPFQSLAEPPSAVVASGDPVNQIAFSSLFLLLGAWTWFHQPQRLALLARPIFVVLLIWCALTCVTSWEPALAARRYTFALILMGIAMMVMLLPKNMRHFSDLMAAVALITLVACLSRRASGAAACRPPGDGFSRARTRRQLARRLRAQEPGRRRDGDDHLHQACSSRACAAWRSAD